MVELARLKDGRIVIAVGDPHAKATNTKEIDMLATQLVYLIERTKKENPEKELIVVVLGDLADTYERIHVLALRAIVSFFRKLTSCKVPIYYVVGNHDMINNQVFLEDFHSFVGISMPYLKIIDKPISDFGFIFCPYTPPGRLQEALEPFMMPEMEGEGPWLKKHLAVFCHQEFRGAKMGAIESKVGDVWPKDFPLAVSGHIHDYDRLAKNVLYVGEPMESSYGTNGDRTVSILRFEPKGTTEERIDIGMPRKITVVLTVAEAATYKIPDNTHVRVNLVGTLEEISGAKKHKWFIELSKAAKVVPKYTDKVVVRTSRERVSYLELLRRSCAGESELVRKAFDTLTQSEQYARQNHQVQAV